MRNAGGYALVVSPDPQQANFDQFRCEEIGPRHETDTFTCWHCNRVVHTRTRAPMDEFGSMCRNCMKMVCPACAKGGCTPFLKQLEEAEKREQTRRMNAYWI